MSALIAAFCPPPLQFEKDPEEADPFGLDQFLSEVRGGKKRALDDIGKSGERSLGGPNWEEGQRAWLLRSAELHVGRKGA